MLTTIPLYHRRFEVGMNWKNNIDSHSNLEIANVRMVHQLLSEIPFQWDYLPDPTNDPLVVLVSFVMKFLFSFLPSHLPPPHPPNNRSSRRSVIRCLSQEKWKSNKNCNNS